MLEGEGFFDRPFPSDSRLVDGHPDLGDFPNAGTLELLDRYLAMHVAIDGWGTSSPLYVRFEEPIDVSALPEPAASVENDSPVLLVDVDATSSERGRAVPVAFEWTEATTAYQPGNLLAVAPVFGFPLRPATTYALVLRSPVARTGAMPDVWEGPEYQGVLEALWQRGIDPEEVAAATVFTTQDPLAETARLARAIHEEIGLGPLDPEVTLVDDRGFVRVYEGYVTVPVWQHGERPYKTEGGGFAFDDDGVPQIAFWERVKFGLTVPEGAAPAAGWPVVLYSHGTGGDWRSFYSSASNDDEGPVLAREGIAMIGISQPLHEGRDTPDTDPELDSFNFANPTSGRCNFRQGALDQVYLAHLLTRESAAFASAEGPIVLDAAHVAYFGHSQGGLVGAIAAPFFSGTVDAAGFSGTGGGLSMTVVLRKDPFDIAELLGSLLELADGEQITTFHPVVGLIQMLSEATDPLNYGRYWFAEEPGWEARPLPMILTEGLDDTATPSLATEALAAAARIPIVGDPATEPASQDLRGLTPDALPTSRNALDWNDAPITAGLRQFADQGHYAIYYDRSARKFYREFLVSSLIGEPTLQ